MSKKIEIFCIISYYFVLFCRKKSINGREYQKKKNNL